MSETGPVAANGSSTRGGHSPEEIVVDFLLALAHNDLDAALDMVTDDIEYLNVSLPTIHGRAALERLARPLLRPGRMGFDVHLNHVASDGDVVLTDRIDELNFAASPPASGSTAASSSATAGLPSGVTRSTGST